MFEVKEPATCDKTYKFDFTRKLVFVVDRKWGAEKHDFWWGGGPW